MQNVTSQNFVELAMRTDTPITPALIERLQDPKCIRLLHAALGLVTEAAEVADMIKKHIFYGRGLDEVNAKEEGGDACWYIALLADATGTTFDALLLMVINKLLLRYPQAFSETCAIDRNVQDERKLLEEFSERADQYAKVIDWKAFSANMEKHIKEYVIPQYGDKGDDPYAENTYLEYMKQIEKYSKRAANPSREGQELLDALKIAHCAQMAYVQLCEEKGISL